MHIYLKEIKREFPGLKPYEDDDLEWINEAMDFFRNEEYDEAAVLLKKLCLSQPDHFDGFEGLAYYYYIKGDFERADWFMQEAIKRAVKFLNDDSIDPDKIEEMENNYQKFLLGETIHYGVGLIFEPLAERVLFAEDEEEWYEQYHSAPHKLRYRMLMETLEHSLPFEVLDEKKVDFKEDLDDQADLQEFFFDYVQRLLDYKEMDELRSLLEKFRSAQPELYRKDYPVYDRYLILIALFYGEKEKVGAYLDNYIKDPVSGIDDMIAVLRQLQYHRLIKEAEHLSRKVCNTIRLDKKLFPGGEIYFEDTIFLTNIERVYHRLQQGEKPTLKEFNEELSEFELSVEEGAYEDLISQIAPGDNRQKVENLLQDQTKSPKEILDLLGWHFCVFLLEHKGFNFVVGRTLFQRVIETLNTGEQDEAEDTEYFPGDSEDESGEAYEDTGEKGTAGQGLPADCFVLQHHKFDDLLQGLGGLLSNQWPQVAGLLWGAPYFYEFLFEYGAISMDELNDTLAELREMQEQFMEDYANRLWRYAFVLNWPLPAGLPEESQALTRERFQKSFSEVPQWIKDKRDGAAAPVKFNKPFTPPKDWLAGDKDMLEEEKRQVAKKRHKKEKNKRKEAKKQKRKQRK